MGIHVSSGCGERANVSPVAGAGLILPLDVNVTRRRRSLRMSEAAGSLSLATLRTRTATAIAGTVAATVIMDSMQHGGNAHPTTSRASSTPRITASAFFEIGAAIMPADAHMEEDASQRTSELGVERCFGAMRRAKARPSPARPSSLACWSVLEPIAQIGRMTLVQFCRYASSIDPERRFISLR